MNRTRTLVRWTLLLMALMAAIPPMVFAARTVVEFSVPACQ